MKRLYRFYIEAWSDDTVARQGLVCKPPKSCWIGFVPPLKPQTLPISIENGATLQNVVTANIGAMLIRALAEQGKLIESQEMADRLQRLEKLLESRSRT